MDVAGQAVAAILTRAPSAGGKSRLFAALGREPDAALLSALLLDTFEGVAQSGVTVAICFAPQSARDEVAALMPNGVLLLPQRGDDLGLRMRSAFDDLLAAGARSVVLVGSDLPLLEPASIRDAVAHLDRDPRSVILGPTRDGGYYLIGAARTPGALLEGVPWSTATVLAHTCRLARQHQIELVHVGEGNDVDTVEDLQRVIDADPTRGRRTRRWAREVVGPNAH